MVIQSFSFKMNVYIEGYVETGSIYVFLFLALNVCIISLLQEKVFTTAHQMSLFI